MSRYRRNRKDWDHEGLRERLSKRRDVTLNRKILRLHRYGKGETFVKLLQINEDLI